MTIQEALKIKDALLTLADALKMKPESLAANVIFLDDDRQKILLEAQQLWVNFYESSMVDRGKMLGITVTEGNGGYKSSIILSEVEDE